MNNKTKLGIFCPSTLTNYEFLAEILDKKVEQIGLIISNHSGHKLPEKYAHEKNIPILSYPIGKNLNVLKANDMIIKASDCIVIFDNGHSENNEKVRKKCLGANKKCNVIQVPEEITCETICDQLADIWLHYGEEGDFLSWLKDHKREYNKLTKILGEL